METRTICTVKRAEVLLVGDGLDETGKVLASMAPDLDVQWRVACDVFAARHLMGTEPAMVMVAGDKAAVEIARCLREDAKRLERRPAFVALVHPSLAHVFAAAAKTLDETAAVDAWGYVTSGCFDEIVAAPIIPATAHSLVSRLLRPRAVAGRDRPRPPAREPKRPRTAAPDKRAVVPRFALVKRVVRRMMLMPYSGKEPEEGLKVEMCDPALALVLGYEDPGELKGKDFLEDIIVHNIDPEVRDKVKHRLAGVGGDVCVCLAKKSGDPSTPFKLRVAALRRAGSFRPVIVHLIPCAEEAAILKHRHLWTLKNEPPPDPYVQRRVFSSTPPLGMGGIPAPATSLLSPVEMLAHPAASTTNNASFAPRDGSPCSANLVLSPPHRPSKLHLSLCPPSPGAIWNYSHVAPHLPPPHTTTSFCTARRPPPQAQQLQATTTFLGSSTLLFS